VKVAIAGATGVLGRALVPKLSEAGHQLRLLVRDTKKAQRIFGEKNEIVECDLLAPGMEAKLVTMLAGCDAAIHIATAIPADKKAPNAWDRNTHLRIRGTGRLQRAAIDAGVATYIQQSIISAYRDCGDEWIAEDTWIDQSPERREIAHPVAIMESMIRMFGKQPKPVRWVILKCGNFVGPGTSQDLLVQRIREGKEIIPGDGSQYVSLVHVEDAAEAFVAALERAPSRSLFNICAEPLRYREYVDQLADALGLAHPKRDLSAERPPSHRAINQAAREVLGWEPKGSLIPIELTRYSASTR
jgi:nucleoside-diphosphate-sugar epimerase